MLTKKYDIKESAKCYLRFSVSRGLVKCFCCKFDFPTRCIELGHYTAKSENGKNSNFVALCSSCNRRQMTVDAKDFFTENALLELDRILTVEFSVNEVFAALVELVELEKEYVTNAVAKITVSEACKRLTEQKQYRTFIA